MEVKDVNINMTVKDLKEIVEQCPDDMPVIIPVITEEDANCILGFRHVRTAGILESELEDPENKTALCLNSSAGGLDISSQISRSDITCKKIMF